MSRKGIVQVTLEDCEFEQLREWAQSEERSVSNMARILLLAQLLQRSAVLQRSAARAQPAEVVCPGCRFQWQPVSKFQKCPQCGMIGNRNNPGVP